MRWLPGPGESCRSAISGKLDVRSTPQLAALAQSSVRSHCPKSRLLVVLDIYAKAAAGIWESDLILASFKYQSSTLDCSAYVGSLLMMRITPTLHSPEIRCSTIARRRSSFILIRALSHLVLLLTASAIAPVAGLAYEVKGVIVSGSSHSSSMNFSMLTVTGLPTSGVTESTTFRVDATLPYAVSSSTSIFTNSFEE